MLPWVESDGDLTPAHLLTKLGAHPRLFSCIDVWVLGQTDVDADADADEDKDVSIFSVALARFLKEHESAVFFCSGDALLNPVPCFAVARVAPGLVSGFMGGIIYT